MRVVGGWEVTHDKMGGELGGRGAEVGELEGIVP